jgi:hypothetical protein
LEHPDQPQYRHRMRLANPTFGPCVWQTPARGVWLALGFVETTDGYAEWRGSDTGRKTPTPSTAQGLETTARAAEGSCHKGTMAKVRKV